MKEDVQGISPMIQNYCDTRRSNELSNKVCQITTRLLVWCISVIPEINFHKSAKQVMQLKY